MIGTVLTFLWWAMVLMLWGFAFIPVPQHSPEWVLQTQAACFGTLANGMPGVQGWMLLILSPLALLSAIWASHAEELYAVPRFLKKSKLARFMIYLLVPATMVVAHWTGKRVTFAYKLSKIELGSTTENPFPVEYPRTNRIAPAFQLTNHKNEIVNQEIFRKRVTFLTFAFAHCSTVCPVLIKDVTTAQKRLSSDLVQTIIITLDPWRDTPSTLVGAAKTWSLDDKSFFLGGDTESISKILDEYLIKSARNERDGNINHAPQVMIVDTSGRIAYSFLNPSVDWLVTAAARLLNE